MSSPQAISALLLCCSLLCGCATARSAAHMTGEIYVAPTIEPDANADSPIAVDLVTVRGAKLLQEVSSYTAQAWYQKRDGLMRLHPTELHATSWEWVPNESVAKIKVPGTAVADGVLLFANYNTPGPHSAKLPRSGTVAVDFGPDDFQISK